MAKQWGGRRVTRTRKLIMQRDNSTCAICGQYTPFAQGHVDHRIPRILGGTDRATNLQWTCARCNQLKGDRTMSRPMVGAVQSRAW